MTWPVTSRTDDHVDFRLRQRRLEYQVQVLAATVIDLTAAVDALAFAGAEPHAAIALRRVHQQLDAIEAVTSGTDRLVGARIREFSDVGQ